MAEQMKPSGIDWIGDIPESWKVRPLKYLAKCNQDVLLETTAPDYSFRYVDIGSVTYERGITGYQELRFEDSPSRARRKVSVGDTIISTVRTYLKAIAIISDSENVIVSTGFAVYTPDEAIYPQYLYYFCKSEGFVQEIDKNSYGIAYPAINTDLLSRICIAYPCYEEQQAIADFLDKECAQIDSITADLEKQIELLQQYKKSLITETVTKGLDKSVPMKDSGVEWLGKIPEHWDVEPIKYRVTFHNGDRGENYPSKSELQSEGIPFINAGHLEGDGLNMDNMDYISEEKYRIMGGVKLRSGDILYCLRGSVGKNAIVDMNQGTVASSLVAIRSVRISAKYLYYCLNSHIEEVQRYLWDNGTAQPNLSADNLGKYKICIPPVEEQMTIVEYLNNICFRIDNLIIGKRKQRSTIQQHKKSFIYEYVTGKKTRKGGSVRWL